MANTVISTVITDAHIQAAEKAWLTTNGGIMEAIHATFVAGYEAAVNERAAAPSTAAGEREKLREALLIFQNHGCPMCGGDCGSANPPVSSCPMQEARAALATPPAQGVEEETETLENLIDAAIGARTAPPWQEQAAQQCEEWALLLSEKSAHAATAFERIQLASNAVKLRDHARAFRALARSEKDEGK